MELNKKYMAIKSLQKKGEFLKACQETKAILKTKMPLWICGGDAPIILESLKKRDLDITHQPNLVLEGLIEIQHLINQGPDLKAPDLPYYLP